MISGSYVMRQKYVNKVCAANLGFPRNLKAGPCELPFLNVQGPRNNFCPGGARLNKKIKILPIFKFLFHESPILGGARAPPAPPVPRPLLMGVQFQLLSLEGYVKQVCYFMLVFILPKLRCYAVNMLGVNSKY